VIFDRRASDIFKCVASTDSNSKLVRAHLKLTRKQYYPKMSLLIKTGLVKKESGRYLLTALGKVICSALLNLEAKFESALNNYWKLKAIDSLPSIEEREKIISVLIGDEEIKTILLIERPNKLTETVNSGDMPTRGDKSLTVEV
jgi:predicted transcriptional regulator